MAARRHDNGLAKLPVELLYEIQLYALSDALPYTSQRLNAVFRSTSHLFRAQYILARVSSSGRNKGQIFTRALRFRICTQEVLDKIHSRLQENRLPYRLSKCELPRRLFKSLGHEHGQQWKDHDQPLPLLRYIFSSKSIPPIDTNSDEGYALTKAVHAQFRPLIRFLLDHDASPACKDGLAVKVAIRQKDLKLVKMLLEREKGRVVIKDGKAKRRKLEDRMKATTAMLNVAVKCDAMDIVQYLTEEKGVKPNMQTLQMMTK